MRAKAYLVKEGNGVWYAKYLNEENHWTKRSLEVTKKSIAKIKFGDFLEKLDKAENRRLEPIKFENARDQYLRWVETNKALSWYIKQRQYFESQITPYFGEKTSLSSLTSHRIELYASMRKKLVKGTTVNKELAALRKFCRKMVEWGHLPFNPTSKIVDLPDDSEPRVRYLSLGEYLLMLEAAEVLRTLPGFSLGLHFQFLTEYILLGCNTGLRPSELLHLEGRDIDLDSRKLRVRRKPNLGFHPKGYHEREVPLNSHAYLAALSLMDQRVSRSDFLFHHRDGTRARSVRGSFETLVGKTQLKEVYPYTLRHTFGAWSVKAGISIRILQKLMGHSTVMVTERYSHVASEDVAAAVNRLNSFLPNLLPSTSEGSDGGNDVSQIESAGAEGGGRTPMTLRSRDFESIPQFCYLSAQL